MTLTTATFAQSAGPDWRAAIDKLEGAYAPSTLRGYRADFAVFAVWCRAAAVAPIPAEPEQVAAFIAADAARSAPATLKRRLCAIRKVHRLLRAPSPVDDEVVNLAFRKALRAKRRRPKQAAGLNAALRDALIAACPPGLQGLRDRAMIAVGYDTLCRRVELVALLAEDLVPLPDGGARVLVRRAKTDPFGDGRWAFISPQAGRALSAWRQAAAIERGPLFRPFRNGVLLANDLHPIVVGRVLKSAAARAGLPEETIRRLSGHSMRVGAAQDLMIAGRDLLQIMTAGGWTSVNVVGRYVRDAQFNIWSERAPA